MLTLKLKSLIPNYQGVKFLVDRSTLSLIGLNIVFIFVSVWEGWPSSNLLFLYWGQSVIIGIFQFIKILELKKFSTEGFEEDGVPIPPTEGSKVSTAYFFATHYGFFHLVYLVFILNRVDLGMVLEDTLPFLGLALLNHSYSYLVNHESDAGVKKNLGAAMFEPYVRIIPMHFTILLASGLSSNAFTLVIFQALKAISEVLTHMIEHRKS